jgi:hypothetical protein
LNIKIAEGKWSTTKIKWQTVYIPLIKLGSTFN